MYRSHHPTFSLQHCIVMQNRLPLAFVPKNFTYYFINSKRRFFLYFKHKEELEQVVRLFQKQNVRFYQRKSIFPDRQQNEEIVFHCNYKYKKKDLRWSLRPDTPIKEPRFRLDQQKQNLVKDLLRQQNKNQFSQNQKNDNFGQKPDEQMKIQNDPFKGFKPQPIQEETAPEYVADFGQIKIKSQQVLDIINNVQLIKALFKAQKKR